MFSRRSKSPKLFRLFIAAAVLAGAVWLASKLHQRFGDSLPLPGAQAAIEDLTPIANLIDAGDLDQARPALENVIKGRASQAVSAEALLLLARLEEKAGALDQAAAHLDDAMRRFAHSSEYPRILLSRARLFEAAGQYTNATQLFEEVRTSAPAEFRAPALTGLGRARERDGELEQACGLYREALADAAADSPAWDEALAALGKANVALVFSGKPSADSAYYEVKRGDTLTKIGVALNTTLGLLTRANGLTLDSNLSEGQRLKYTPKEFRIVIERSTCRLYVFDRNGIFKRYETGLGMEGHETTLGKYKIGNKQKDPTWHKPGVGPIPPGDPANELGTRWMPLVPVEEGLPTDLGIHGTTKPESVGAYSSHGCARLIMPEVEELFDLVVRSTPVEIVEKLAPEELNPKQT